MAKVHEDHGQYLFHICISGLDEDWQVIEASQRVQIIKKHPKTGGALKLGTEIECSADRSLPTILGASPVPRHRCRSCYTYTETGINFR